MEKQYRQGSNLESAYRHAARTDVSPVPEEPARPELMEVPTAPAVGRRTSLKALLRKPARFLWRAARPFAIGPAHRLRRFLMVPVQEDLNSVYGKLRQDVINTQTWAYQEQLRLTASMLQEMVAVREAMAREIGQSDARNEQRVAAISKLMDRLLTCNSTAAVPAATPSAADVLDPQLGRIETYAMKAAGRIAIPVADDALLIRTAVGYVLCDNGDSALLVQLLETGELEEGTRRLIERVVGPGDTFVDVGANIGMHTIAAARAMRGDGRVIAYEPFPRTVQLLSDSLWMNGLASLCELHDAAVSDHPGEQPLFLGRTSGHHSLVPLAPEFSGRGDAVTVRLVTLDDTIAEGTRVDLLKIDAEGAELNVLYGARRLIAENQDIALIVELGASHLRRTGYSVGAWLERFQELGFGHQVIDAESGQLLDWSLDQLEVADSVNLYMRRSHRRSDRMSG